eukprot:gene14572-20615_t
MTPANSEGRTTSPVVGQAIEQATAFSRVSNSFEGFAQADSPIYSAQLSKQDSQGPHNGKLSGAHQPHSGAPHWKIQQSSTENSAKLHKEVDTLDRVCENGVGPPIFFQGLDGEITTCSRETPTLTGYTNTNGGHQNSSPVDCIPTSAASPQGGVATITAAGVCGDSTKIRGVATAEPPVLKRVSPVPETLQALINSLASTSGPAVVDLKGRTLKLKGGWLQSDRSAITILHDDLTLCNGSLELSKGVKLVVRGDNVNLEKLVVKGSGGDGTWDGGGPTACLIHLNGAENMKMIECTVLTDSGFAVLADNGTTAQILDCSFKASNGAGHRSIQILGDETVLVQTCTKPAPSKAKMKTGAAASVGCFACLSPR